MPGRRWCELGVVVAVAAGCRQQTGSTLPRVAGGAGEDGSFGNPVVVDSDARPKLVLVPREGDPRAAMAALVVTGASSYQAAALSALLEARLQKSGFASADARADRDSFRLRALVETPERAVEFARAVQRALAAPVVPATSELVLAARHVASLRRRPLEAPIAGSVARCTGELGALSSDPAPDTTTGDGAASLDAIRAAANAARRVAFGIVGPPSLTEIVADAWGGTEKWSIGSVPEGGLPGDDEVGAYSTQARGAGPARVTVAISARRAENAVVAAARAGAADGALSARLRALATPFRVAEATGSVRPRGGCVAVSIEAVRPSVAAGGFEEAAATAATIVRQEIEASRSLLQQAPTLSPEPRLGDVASRAIRAAGDPREAAELAALWSLTIPAEDREQVTIALALPPSALDPREGGADAATRLQASSKRLSVALDRLEKAWSTPVLERRGRVERGQGEIWLLLASPCGVLAEVEGDTGTTALAVMAALAARNREARDVTLEPWITPDGAGIIVHGSALAGESATAQSTRLAEEAARALAATPFSQQSFAAARAALLNHVGDGISSEGRAMSALASALSPGHPSWLAPLGSWDELAKGGADAASLRWAAIVAGPLRVAVLANENPDQGDRAARAIDRWLVRGAGQTRICSPVEPAPTPKAGTVLVTLPASNLPQAQALVGVAVAPQGSAESAWAELTLAALSGADGSLTKALSATSFAASAQARLVGGVRAAALVVDVRAPEASIDSAVAQVRALFDRLRQGSMTSGDFERGSAVRDRWDLEASLDPRRRLVDLWRDPRPNKLQLSLDGWRAWAAATLRDERLTVVLAKPRH